MNHNIYRTMLTITIASFFSIACGRPDKKSTQRMVTTDIPQVVNHAVHIEKNTQNGITIQDLNQNESFSGAGATFSLASAPESSDGIIFGYSSDDDATGIRVNDHLFKLKQVGIKTLQKAKNEQGIGDRFLNTWSGDGIVVEFDYTITSVGESYSGFKGYVHITLGDKKASFKITGGGGC